MFASTEPPSVRATALTVADRIAARLVRDAVREGRRATWLGDQMDVVNGQWAAVLKPCGADVYSGTSGIAMFLARMHRVAGEPLFARTAEAALEHAVSQLDGVPEQARAALWSGWAGVAWALLDAGAVLGRSTLIEQGLQLVRRVEQQAPSPDAIDIVSGSAGVIPFLLDVYRRYGQQSAIDAAVRHGELLLASAQSDGDVCSWHTMPQLPGTDARDLTGLSHGAGGVALALFELAAATGITPFADAAHRGFAYEQRYFSSRHNNWPDLREMAAGTPESQWGYSATWCHGAPGIALARLRAWQLTGVAEYRQQGEIALRTTAATVQSAAPGMETWCLCHGTAGNADVLLVGAEMLTQPSWSTLAHQAAIRGSETYEAADLPWPPGVNGGAENPSLMLGNAGVGWFFLRLAQPEETPSLLLFRPPT
jgi:lantibiotic modifying enzyme